jgi:tetratricopeptide (TPR) repeat protein
MSARRSRNRRNEIAATADLKAGIALHQAGRVDEAEAIYRQVLKAAPNSGEALHLLGLVSHDRGDSARAMQFVQMALEAMPESAPVHLSLGNLLRASDQFDAATKSYRRAIALKPDFAHAHCNLASALNQRGLHEEAAESATRAVELMPGLAEAHFNHAAALAGRRRLVDAEATYRRVLALEPDNARTLTDLGQVLTELKRFDEAIGSLRRAAELQPENAGILLRLAATLILARDPEGSEAACRTAIDLAPDLPRAWSGLGTATRALGRFDEARAHYERALALDPELSDAHAGLAVIGRLPSDEAQVSRLRTLAASPETEIEQRVWLSFALGTMLDNAGRYDEAFSSFAQGNTLLRERLAAWGEVYDHDALRRRVADLIESLTPEFYSAVEPDGNPSETPVFIVGMPRSGTSLVEQIAASHSRISAAGELRDLSSVCETVFVHGKGRSLEEMDPGLARRLADDYVAKLQRLGAGSARVVDKMPDNVLHLGVAALLFPGARVVFCRRDLRDISLSCYFHHFNESMAFAQDLADCARRALEIERLADHWRRVLPLRMHTIDYEALVADLEGESRRLIAFLGLDWEPACLEFHKTERPVLTASAWQVRQPLYSHSAGRWRHYQGHLGPLLQVLATADAEMTAPSGS